MKRRAFLQSTALALFSPLSLAAARAAPALTSSAGELQSALEGAARLGPIESIMADRSGVVVTAKTFGEGSLDRPTNIKSASKSIISALVGIAIDKGLLSGPDQAIAPLLRRDLPPRFDPRVEAITVGHLLSMQSGLTRTSGANYGAWVASRNWIRAALAQPFVDEPGGRMLYSTGSTHLLSAILTRVSGRSTLALAQEWFGAVPGFRIASWERDPQGIYLGGNQMAMSPRSLLAFGMLYRNGGRAPTGEQIVPEEWVRLSWQPRTASAFTGDAYGYGWFLRTMAGRAVRYAWGYGGQMLYVVPELELTIVVTSDESQPSARTGYRDEIHALASLIIAEASRSDAGEP
jgi:CubicO group peptidase (beta-lactamase class C family)